MQNFKIIVKRPSIVESCAKLSSARKLTIIFRIIDIFCLVSIATDLDFQTRLYPLKFLTTLAVENG